jgi:glycosyltransferase involved in cell wall biosynthesis
MDLKEPIRVRAFFQHMPPYSGAAALRGASILGALAQMFGLGATIEAFTTIPEPMPLTGVAVIPIGVPEVENASGLMFRVFGELRIGLAAARAMFNDGTHCDLAIISSPGYLASLIIAVAARYRHIPYVVELRDVYPQVYAEAGLLSRESALYRFFARRTKHFYEGAHAVLAATHGLARTVLEDAPDAVVHTVYNGFPSSLMVRQATRHERFTVCFHGVMGFFQDIEMLVEVARRLSAHEVDMVVIGYGRKDGLVAGAGLTNLRFLGRLTFDQTMAEIERCHIGLCLRKDERISRDAFPVKVWEYIGLGIPCLVTPTCEAGDFIESHGCGYQFPAGDASCIVDAILALKQDPITLSAMSARCRNAARDYTREKTGLQAARIVAKCLKERKNWGKIPETID